MKRQLNWRYDSLLRRKYGRQNWILVNRQGYKGYFKFPTSTQGKKYRIMMANEMIALSLAKLVGLPVPKQKLITIKGRKGIRRKGLLSEEAMANEVIPWRMAKDEVHHNPELFIENSRLLAQLIAFDAWILNPDRTNRNLILYRNHPAERYKWYLIDHGIALFGSPGVWSLHKAKRLIRSNDSVIFAIHKQKRYVFKIPIGLWAFAQRNKREIDIMIAKIQALTKKDLFEAINDIPPRYLKRSEKTFLRKLLLSRREQLPLIVNTALKQLQFSTQ